MAASCVLFCDNVHAHGHTLPQVAVMVMTGILVWTLIEYTLHRFLFHIETKSYWTNTVHYLLHGCHHKHPMDGLRLVFPPAATAILLFPFWNLVRLFTTATTCPAIFGGGLLGYVIYDCTHYYLHHGKPTKEPAKHLKRYHLNHHFRIQQWVSVSHLHCGTMYLGHCHHQQKPRRRAADGSSVSFAS
ncbi:dihydroceramide fatty acyl 2-hydroxylase FAH2-like [Iris pallida]|uniref:Dihydroceramide fatty acyl 2-hydroxylase FAH2-like n=1 Tax=Iris pallida TaxID=29817 RepID=A0AAX6FG05_IRIPA|nr:dihydroceramide fatty acyl 2-hydroxylase FAH2-like [Iris pallida]